MPLYFLKPVVWNSLGYKRPSGERVTSGYPAEHGFGHEEWNAADTSTVLVGGRRMRAFHTERFGNQLLDDCPGDIFVFMIASHRGGQYLVGIAGGATSLISDQHAQRRREYSYSIASGNQRWTETWSVPTVKACYRGDVDKFREHWEKDLQWVANWICPPELFHWLAEPMLLDSSEISGKRNLVKMFGSYQAISRATAARIAAGIRPAKASTSLANIIGRLASDESDCATDIARLKCDDGLDPTTREALVQARLGQGKFRDDLMTIWNGACSVTGCDVRQVLRASHIKPWNKSTNTERRDPENGLLLAATIDALFDNHLISFEDSGEMLVSSSISAEQRRMLGLPTKLRKTPTSLQCRYLAQHRDLFALWML
jgi:predicted restriction endonuclease